MDLKNNHYIMPDTLFFQNNIKKRFDNCAQSFFDFDFIHRHCRKDLIGRLAPIKIAPQQAVDLGSALGSSAIFLEKNYPACCSIWCFYRISPMAWHRFKFFNLGKFSCYYFLDFFSPSTK